MPRDGAGLFLSSARFEHQARRAGGIDRGAPCRDGEGAVVALALLNKGVFVQGVPSDVKTKIERDWAELVAGV